MERIFTNALKKQLKQRIKGDVSVHVKDDTLIVDIQPVGFWSWHYTINNLAVQMSADLSSRIVADVIVKQYKKYIRSKHFTQNNSKKVLTFQVQCATIKE